MQWAKLLRSGRVAEADPDHIAEEIENMAKRERCARAKALSTAGLASSATPGAAHETVRALAELHRRAALSDSQAARGEL